MAFTDYILPAIGVTLAVMILYYFWPPRMMREYANDKKRAEEASAKSKLEFELKYAEEIATGEMVFVKAVSGFAIIKWLPQTAYLIGIFATLSFGDLSDDCHQIWGLSGGAFRYAVFEIAMSAYAVIFFVIEMRNYRLALKDGYAPARSKPCRVDTISVKLTSKKRKSLKSNLLLSGAFSVAAISLPIVLFLWSEYGLSNHYTSFADMKVQIHNICLDQLKQKQQGKPAQ